MKNQIITTFLTAIFLVTATIPAFSQSTEQLFQEGIMKEEGEGNLSEAINIFNSIVENSTAEESLQAKALLHVGLCYEKLGKEEATKAYQELVNKFPGQENEVAIARERLSQLIQVAETILTTPIEPKFTKVRTPFNIPQWSGSRLSPDGKILAFGSENNIWTVPIQGKVDPDLAGEPNKLEGASDVLGEGLSWSGDGRFIAFSRVYTRDLRGGGTLINFNPDGAYIDVIPSSGGEPKRIPIPHWLETNGDTQRKLSMSSDGKLVAFDSGGQIYVATVETGDIRQVTKDGGISPCFSPDGKKIAYLTPGIYQDNPPARLHEVWVISTEGGDPVKVSGNLTENLSNKGPTWSPDGSMIAFGRVNTEGEVSSEVCIVNLSDEGRPIAPPVQIELPLFSTDFLTGWTPDNKIGLILESPYHEYVYTVPVSGGKATQVSPLDGLAGIPNWSSDGEHIYFRWKGGGLGSVPGDGGEVSVHSGIDRLRNETGFFTVYPGAGNSVSPDGKSIVFSGAMASEGPYIYTIPIGGGEPKQVTDKEGNYPCWSPNGNWIAYLALEEIDDNKSITTIYKVPKDGGESQKITTSTNNVTAGGFDWSPDGTTIAYFSKKEDAQAGTLNLVPANGGESIEVCQIQNITAHNNVSWSPDGQKIAFVSSGKIWIVQAQGGQPVEVKTDVDAWAGTLDWSPDGQKIAFSAESGMKPEFWFLEDFLPQDDSQITSTQKDVIPKFSKINIPTELSWYMKLSPDGKELAMVSDKKLWKLPLPGNLGPGFSGVPFQLNTEGIEVDHQAGLSWSQDGNWIAFNQFPLNDTLVQKKGFQSIFVIPSEGGSPKKVTENFRAGRIENYWISLSPDGKTIAHSSIENNAQHIYTTSVSEGSSNQLVDVQAREPAFSSDGEWIAYVEDENFGTGGGNLWIVPASGGDSRLIAEAGYATSPVWSPDNSMIAYVDDDKKTQINIVDVTKEGHKIKIDAPEGTEEVDLLAGWTSDNRIGARIIKKEEFAIYSLPVEGGMATEVLHDCWAMMPRWSPDGSQIYYTTSRIEGSQQAFQLSLASVPANGGVGSFLPENNPGGNVWQLGNQGGNRISPDAKTIISAAWDELLPDIGFPLVNLWKFRVDGSEPEKITDKKGYANFSPSWSPDGIRIAFIRAKLNVKSPGLMDTVTVVTVNSSGDDEKILLTVSDLSLNSLVWSPDGKMLAYLSSEKKIPNRNYLNFIDAVNGTSIYKWEVSDADTDIELAWAPDSRRIAFNDGEGKVIKIMDIENGNIEDIKTNLEDITIGHIDWSPDGEKFVFVGQRGGNAEFWFLEDFLPQEKLAQNNEPVPEDEGIVIKQAWTGSDVDNFGSISQDGEYLSYVNWDTGDLSLRNLSTKQNSSLVQGNWDTPMQYAQYNVISPNGKQIAYQWFNDNASDLYLINIDNPIPKLLYRKEDANVFPISWLSNNKIIIGINNKVVDDQIGSYSIVDGTLEILKTFNQINWAWLTSSPDENYIAYDYVNRSQDGTFDINLLSMDGKGEIALVEHPANDKVLGWMPENNEFLFISDRSGTWDLWAIAVDNGKPLGQERRIYTDIGEVKPLGITKNGECFYGFSNRNFNAYILPVNNLTGNPEGNPEIPLAGSIYSKNWSPDGKYMARVQEGEGGFELIIRDEENGNERRLAEELFYILAPYWSRDQQSLYIFGMDMKELQTNGYEGSIFTLDLKSNNLKEQLLISDYNYTPPKDAAPPIAGHAVSDDQQYIYLLFQNDWIVKHDLINGKDTILYRHPQFVRGVFQLSPDGNKLLFAIQNEGENMSRLLTISTQGGDEMELCTSQESNISGSAFWSPDGKYVYFSERHEGTNLWKVDANGGTPEKVWHTDKGAESFIMHPSGEKISYSVRERTTEIRVIEGLAQEIEKVFDGEN